MLKKTQARRQAPVEGRKIGTTLVLNYNKNAHGLSQNLKLLISVPQQQQIESMDIERRRSMDGDNLKRRLTHTSSTKLISSKNKENYNSSNMLAARKTTMPKSSSKSFKKEKSNLVCRPVISHIHKKSRSPSSSLQKKAKSLSKVDKKSKKSKSLKRKSLSPQQTYKLQKPQKTDRPRARQSKPISAYTSRQTKTSYNTIKAKGSQTDRERLSKPSPNDESPNSLSKMLPIKKKTKKVQIEEKPVLKDLESISLAKELQGMLQKYKKIKAKNPIKNASKNKSVSKSKVNKSKKIIVSQQTSKHRDFYSKQEDLDVQLLTHRYRESYQPKQKPPKRTKSRERPATAVPILNKHNLEQFSMKTEYSVPSLHVFENIAATKIQKCFRGYLARKQIEQYKRIISAVITIQRFWRGYQVRKKMQKNLNMPKQLEESLCTIKDFNGEEKSASQNSSPNQSPSPNSDRFVERGSDKKMFENDSISKKLFPSPKDSRREIDLPLRQRPQILIESPTNILDNLPNLQRIHRQKLQRHSKIQKEALQKLVQQKLCSPKTFEFKIKEIDERFQYEVDRFETGVREVMRGWNLTNDQGFLTPESRKSIESQDKKTVKDFKNEEFEEKKIEDISVELSQYVDEPQKAQDFSSWRFDSSLMFIEPYLAGLFMFLQEKQHWREDFMEMMKTPKSISLVQLLKNLACVTEDSDDDNNFKLPLYKYLRYEQTQPIDQWTVQQFHRQYKGMKRHSGDSKASELQQIHSKVIVDVLNEQLNRQRPTKKLLDFQRLRFSAKVHRTLLARQLPTQQLLFHNYFAYALQEVFKTASCLCGFIEDTRQIQQNYLTAVNEVRLTQMINGQIQRNQKQNCQYEQQVIETIVSLAEQVFHELMDEAAESIWQAYI